MKGIGELGIGLLISGMAWAQGNAIVTQTEAGRYEFSHWKTRLQQMIQERQKGGSPVARLAAASASANYSFETYQMIQGIYPDSLANNTDVGKLVGSYPFSPWRMQPSTDASQGSYSLYIGPTSNIADTFVLLAVEPVTVQQLAPSPLWSLTLDYKFTPAGAGDTAKILIVGLDSAGKFSLAGKIDITTAASTFTATMGQVFAGLKSLTSNSQYSDSLAFMVLLIRVNPGSELWVDNVVLRDASSNPYPDFPVNASFEAWDTVTVPVFPGWLVGRYVDHYIDRDVAVIMPEIDRIDEAIWTAPGYYGATAAKIKPAVQQFVHITSDTPSNVLVYVEPNVNLGDTLYMTYEFHSPSWDTATLMILFSDANSSNIVGGGIWNLGVTNAPLQGAYPLQDLCPACNVDTMFIWVAPQRIDTTGGMLTFLPADTANRLIVDFKLACSVPVADFTYTIQNDTEVVFTNTSINANSYLWFFGTGDTSSAVSPTYAYSAPGTYTVCLVAINAACNLSDSTCKSITITVTDMESAHVSALQVHQYGRSVELVHPKAIRAYRLLTIDGRQVAVAPNINKQVVRLSLEGLAEGVYVLEVETPDGTGRWKVVIR